jgi:hypothetical protein
MMSISHSVLMPISSERSDAEPSQCETVIDISQDSLCISGLDARVCCQNPTRREFNSLRSQTHGRYGMLKRVNPCCHSSLP